MRMAPKLVPWLGVWLNCGACGRLKGVSCDGGAGQGDCQDARSLGELRIAGLGVDHGSGNRVCSEIHMKASGARKFGDLRGGVD